MGSSGSTASGTATRTVDRSSYRRRHPGLYNNSTGGIESEVARRTRAYEIMSECQTALNLNRRRVTTELLLGVWSGSKLFAEAIMIALSRLELTDKPLFYMDRVPSDEKDLIQVSKVDLNARKNAKAHRTDKFEITDALVHDSREDLVVRRGQEFVINVEFNRPYDPEKDEVKLVCEFGDAPKNEKGTREVFILSDRDVIRTKEGNSLTLVLNSSPSCAVGKWSLNIDVIKRSENDVEVFRYKPDSPIYMYILFNPWCKDDLVYMSEERNLGEYVLNDTGKIYSGNYKKISPKPWVFGQFESDVLDCAIRLLDESNLSNSSRGDPIKVVRMISAVVNAPDDNGVLVGNWSGDYEGGISPLKWTGSEEILLQYYKTRKPVKYGQCWVFSGVVTTVCRALGIPARSVTNFASAHDTDGSITIDCHYDQKGKPLDCYDEDSVWNFHVWNDVWTARPDLPPGYGGWQAIDATPQETSEGVFRMGPTSLCAVKRGELYYPYDACFLFAEVNADRVYWQRDANHEMKKVYVQEHGIGKFISTKRAYGRATWTEMMHGDPDREDITDQYKFGEGTDEERAAVHRANLTSSKKVVYETEEKDVEFELCANPDTFMGDMVKFCLKVKNTSDSKRTMNGTLTFASMYYTGVFYKLVKQHEIERTVLQPKEEKCIDVEVDVDEYLDKLADHCICKIYCMCFVDETKQVFAEMEDQRLRKPHLTIKAADTGVAKQKFEFEVSFVNPLPETLTKCEVRVDGPGLQRPKTYGQPNVGAKTTYTGKFEICPEKPGDRELIVYFNCAQIMSVNVSHWINVTESN